MTVVVDFLRHGETEAGDALLGRTDPPLSAAGREGVTREIRARQWSAIVTSPLLRARETAAIAAMHGGQTIEIDPAWREIDFGDWDGQPRQSLIGDARLAAFYTSPDANPPPNGESMGAVRTRITGALERIAAREQGPVLVVAHGGTIRMTLSVLIGVPLERLWAIRIACLTRIRVGMGVDPTYGLWGEIVEIAQPGEEGAP